MGKLEHDLGKSLNIQPPLHKLSKTCHLRISLSADLLIDFYKTAA